MLTEQIQRWVILGMGAALVSAGTGIAYLGVRLAQEKTAHATTIANHSAERTAQADAARLEEAAQREVETLRRKARERNVDEIAADLARTRDAAGDLRPVTGRVRDEVAAVAARAGAACGGPAAAARGASGPAPVVVLSELYAGVDREAEELAAAFDDARARGLGCERAYDSIEETARRASRALLSTTGRP